MGDLEKVTVPVGDDTKPGDEKDEKKPAKAADGGDPGDENDEGEDEEDSAEVEDAKKLFAALKNPHSARAVIESLAREAGFEISTPTQKKDAKKGIVEMLAEELGETYGFLAPKLGPAIQKALDMHTEAVEKKFREASERDIARETDKAVVDMQSKHEDFMLHEKAILGLMKEISPSGGISQLQYLEKLYRLAKAEAGTTKKSNSDKVKKADNDVPNRLKGASVGGDDSKHRTDHSPISRRQAIREAMEELAVET